MGRESRRISLTWKIGGVFAGVIVTLGFLVMARSLERMRSSLKAAMLRLGRETA
jgi:hypothetical protein